MAKFNALCYILGTLAKSQEASRAMVLKGMEVPSVCPLDCPDTCSLNVTVSEGRVTKVRGSEANPYTAGVICNKVARSYPEFVHGPERLTEPLRRVGARGVGRESYESVSWDAALDAIHEGFCRAMEAHGPEAVMPLNYAGPHGALAAGSMDRRFFHKLGATLLERGPLCGGVRGAAYDSVFGRVPGMAPEQVVHADMVIIWGSNTTVSYLHLMRLLKRARSERGTKIVVVDPRRTKIAEQADLHLPLTPGTDVVLALALAAELERRDALDRDFIARWTEGFEPFMAAARRWTVADVERRCGLSAESFHRLAAWYASAETVAANFGNGIERGCNGGSGLRAGMLLQALTGNHGRLGAGVIAKVGYIMPHDEDALQRPDLAPAGTRRFNILDVAERLLESEPPVLATMIYNHNPVAVHPHQSRLMEALMREDLFIAGADIAMTDSMAFADIILPVSSHFEAHDVYGAYGQQYVQRAAPVIPPVGSSVPNTEIFRRLAARFGFDDPLFREDDMALMDTAMRREALGRAASALPLDEAVAMKAEDGEEAVLCKNVFPRTPSGKIEFFSEDLEARFGCGVPRFVEVHRDLPLALLSPASDKRTNATFGGCAASGGLEVLMMNPRDARARGLEDGMKVVVHNGRGRVVLRLAVSEMTRPGVLFSPKGTWRRTSETGMTVNALIPSDVRTDIADGACYNETFVEVAAA